MASIENLRKAALAGDASAAEDLLEYYAWEQPTAIEDLKRFSILVAGYDRPKANFFLAYLDYIEGNHEATEEQLDQLATKGYSPAMFVLGRLGLKGMFTRRTRVENARLIRSAAERGHIYAKMYVVTHTPPSGAWRNATVFIFGLIPIWVSALSHSLLGTTGDRSITWPGQITHRPDLSACWKMTNASPTLLISCRRRKREHERNFGCPVNMVELAKGQRGLMRKHERWLELFSNGWESRVPWGGKGGSNLN
jgi:hypothetical protein